MNDFAKILAALESSGVAGLASGQYRPADDMKDDSRPAFSREYGCVIWAVGGRTIPAKHYGDARGIVCEQLGVSFDNLHRAERENDRCHIVQNTPEACVARLAHVRQWLKEQST